MTSLVAHSLVRHLVVAYSCASLFITLALRDNNNDKGTSIVGVGQKGQSWRLAYDDDDDDLEASPGASSSHAKDHMDAKHAGGGNISWNSSNRTNASSFLAVSQPDNEEEQANQSKTTEQTEQNKSTHKEKKKIDLSPEALHEWRMGTFAEQSWGYNPFRIYISEENERKNDLQCPKISEWGSTWEKMPRGERHMCALRYVILHICPYLPNSTSTTRECTDEGRVRCPLMSCFQKIPFLWVKAYLFTPGVIVIGHVVLGPLFDIVLRRLMMFAVISKLIHQYIGTHEKAPTRPYFRIYLLVIQIAASMATVLFFCVMDMAEPPRLPWNTKSDLREPWIGWFQFCMNCQMMVNYYITWFKMGFSWDSVLSTNMLIDVCTVHRTLLRQALYTPADPPLSDSFNVDLETEFLFLARPRMNLHFLRAYRCLSALLEIQDMGAMDRFSAVVKQLIKSGLRLFALVILFSGTMSLLEWFGHDLSLNLDSNGLIGECKNQLNLKENIACVPFMVGIYWVFTTISTVGYGDLAPHSFMSYLLVIIIIVAGVTFFSLESSTLVEVMSLENHGLSSCLVAGEHVVLTGGAMRDVDHCVLYQFTHQLLHRAVTEQGGEWPFLVFLGKIDAAGPFNKFIETNMTVEMKRHIQFCNADPLTPEGLAHAKVDKASIVYILPSSHADDFAREDEYNIHVALSIRAISKNKNTRTVPFRLVLFRPSSLELAMTSGIHAGQCLCLDQLRTAILAQASEVRGWPCLLMGLTSNTTYDPSISDQYCKQSLFPEEYGETCENSLWGFAVSKMSAGKPFNELAGIVYRQTGALLICAQINGKVRDFPWDEIIAPNTVVFCIHNKDPCKAVDSDKYCSKLEWRPLFMRQRLSSIQTGTWTKELAKEMNSYIKPAPAELSEEVMSDEDVEAHRLKVESIKNGDKDFIFAVMTACESYWQLLTMYLDKICITGRDTGYFDGFSVIAFVTEPPPVNIVEYLDAGNPDVKLAFFIGEWMEPESLKIAGAEQAKVIVTFPVHSLRSMPDNDTRTFFLLRLIARMNLRPECVVLSELTSGMSGAHMIPLPRSMAEQGELQPKQPKELEEDCFNPSCAAGQLFVPRSLLGLVAKSYYTFGIVETVQNLTFNLNDDTLAVRPVQITIPESLHGQCYGQIVEAMMAARVGPCPAVCIGILRETLYSEAVMLHPKYKFRTTKADLLIVLASGTWIVWAQEAKLRCFGGRSKRTANGI